MGIPNPRHTVQVRVTAFAQKCKNKTEHSLCLFATGLVAVVPLNLAKKNRNSDVLMEIVFAGGTLSHGNSNER